MQCGKISFHFSWGGGGRRVNRHKDRTHTLRHRHMGTKLKQERDEVSPSPSFGSIEAEQWRSRGDKRWKNEGDRSSLGRIPTVYFNPRCKHIFRQWQFQPAVTPVNNGHTVPRWQRVCRFEPYFFLSLPPTLSLYILLRPTSFRSPFLFSHFLLPFSEEGERLVINRIQFAHAMPFLCQVYDRIREIEVFELTNRKYTRLILFWFN